jgi:hypothetical protein
MNDDDPRSRESAKKKYPVSVKNQQCIGPCYYKGTKAIHPMTLEVIENNYHNFCPVSSFLYKDENTGKTDTYIADICLVPTAKETLLDDYMKQNVMNPKIEFSSDFFMKIYYNINTLDELLNWLESNRNNPYLTKKRVFDNGCVIHGDKINVVDQRIVMHIDDIMNYNIDKIYNDVKKFLKIDGEKVILSSDLSNYVTNNIDANNMKKMKNFIKDKFLGYDNINKFMSKFLRYYKYEMTNGKITDTLVINMIDYIKKRILTTFDNANDI